MDYGQSLEQMIAAGRYDWKNGDITAKRFPVEGKGIIEFDARYFHFDRNIGSDEAKRLIEEDGWQVAKIEHVLSHGKTFPDEQRQYPSSVSVPSRRSTAIAACRASAGTAPGATSTSVGGTATGDVLSFPGRSQAVLGRLRLRHFSAWALGNFGPFGVRRCLSMRRFCFVCIIETTSEKSEVTAPGNLSATRATRVQPATACWRVSHGSSKIIDSWCGAPCDD